MTAHFTDKIMWRNQVQNYPGKPCLVGSTDRRGFHQDIAGKQRKVLEGLGRVLEGLSRVPCQEDPDAMFQTVKRYEGLPSAPIKN
jgi:hypothetical protein